MIKISLKNNIDPNLLSNRASKTEKAIAMKILTDTARFVPAKTGILTNRSYVRGNNIIYPGPYARYLYYGVAMVNAKTGKGPMNIPEVGYRWPRKAVLRPTSRPLKFSTDLHPDATAKWMEVSKNRNMEKWEKIAARIYTDG